MITNHNRSNTPWTPALEAQVIALAGQGLTARDIGAAVGMTKNQIIGWCDRKRNGRGILQQLPCCSYKGPTTLERLQALHDKMDAVLAESRLIPRLPPNDNLRHP